MIAQTNSSSKSVKPGAQAPGATQTQRYLGSGALNLEPAWPGALVYYR